MGRLLILKLVFLCALALGQSASAQEYVLRFQHFLGPRSSPHKLFMQPWADRIEKQSDGRIKIELYTFMQLGGRRSGQYDLIRDGAIDGGWIVPGYQPGRFPRAEALELPFILSKSSEQASRAAWIFTQEHLLDDFSDLKLIAAHMGGSEVVHSKGVSPSRLEDFRGVTLRAATRSSAALLEKLGAEVVRMPAPAFPDAMARGALSGGIETWDLAPTLRLDELADHHLDVAGDKGLANTYYIWAMNQRSYDNLPPDLQAVIDANSGLEPSALAGRAYDEGDVIGRQRMAVAGHTMATLNAPQTARLRDVAKAVELDWIVDMTIQGHDGVGLLADAKRIMTDVLANRSGG